MYCRKEMVKMLKCYLIPKKVMALCLKVQFFFGPTLYNTTISDLKTEIRDKNCKLFTHDYNLADRQTFYAVC